MSTPASLRHGKTAGYMAPSTAKNSGLPKAASIMSLSPSAACTAWRSSSFASGPCFVFSIMIG